MKNLRSKFILYKTYLARLRKLPGTRMFQNTYFEIDGKVIDVTKNGALSCASVVSNFLFMFNKFPDFVWIKEPHVTVEGTIKDMEECGWYETDTLKMGAILIWEAKFRKNDCRKHRHIGFCRTPDLAISNNSERGYPIEHHFTFGGTRNIEKILWHPALEK